MSSSRKRPIPVPTDDAPFGDVLLYYRAVRAKMTQETLASGAGCTKGYISTLERGGIHSTSGGEMRPSETLIDGLASTLAQSPRIGEPRLTILNTLRNAAGYKSIGLPPLMARYSETLTGPTVAEAPVDYNETLDERLTRIESLLKQIVEKQENNIQK